MVEKSKEYISCLANDKVGICVISLVLDRRHLKSDNKYPIALRFTRSEKVVLFIRGKIYRKRIRMLFVEQRILPQNQYKK